MKKLSSVLLRNLRLICAYEGELDATDLLIKDGVIQAVHSSDSPGDVTELDCSGMFACQGFVDLLAEGGEPGNEDREDFASLGDAAIKAGFT
ncbi:MAG: dihydroorotase, partial [Bradymonadia bacterium]